MRLFGWLRRTPQEIAPQEKPRRWVWLGGRRMLTGSLYVMPKDKEEENRLDLQHHLFKLALGGNYRAPIRQPRAILDVACGTGIWARELALQFKQAQVVGFDIDIGPAEAARERLAASGLFPANVRFLEADALKPFPFEDEQFDFTHARLIGPFVPTSRWVEVVAEMRRVTRRGGYVELVDVEFPHSNSEAFNYLQTFSKRLMTGRGLNAGSAPHLAEYLRQAKLARVQERRFLAGAGRHRERERRLLLSDFLSGTTNMRPILVKSGLLSEEEAADIVERVAKELPTANLTWPITCAFGIKL